MQTSQSFPRAVHAQTMDRVYRYQRHVYDLTRRYYLFGRDRLLRELDIPDGGRVLEMGCGTGRNLAISAKSNPQALFYGVDISQQMLLSARAQTRKAGVGRRVFTAIGDAETFDAADHFALVGFERVVLSYSLSMIPNWRLSLKNAFAQVAPGGSLHIVDFGQMECWPELAHGLMRMWLKRFFVSPRADLAREAELVASSCGGKVRFSRIAGGYAWLIVIEKPSARPVG